jgi:uncharacterized protein
MASGNVQIVSDIYDGFIVHGSLATLLEHLDAGSTITEAPSLPFAGVYRGRAEIEGLFGHMFETWEDMRIAKEKLFDGGDQVVAILRLTGRSRATGKAIDMQVSELWTLREGKVVSLTPFYWDTGEVARIVRPDPT